MRLAWGRRRSRCAGMGTAAALAARSRAVQRPCCPRASGSVFIWAIALVFAVSALLIASRQPGNAIGWIFWRRRWRAGLAMLGSLVRAVLGRRPGGSEALGKAAALYADALLDAVHPGARHLPPAAVSRRSPAVAPLATGRVVRRGGHRGKLRGGGFAPGPIRGLSSGHEPDRGEQSVASICSRALPFSRLVIGVVGSSASLIVRFRRSAGRAASADEVARVGGSCGRRDAPDRTSSSGT